MSLFSPEPPRDRDTTPAEPVRTLTLNGTMLLAVGMLLVGLPVLCLFATLILDECRNLAFEQRVRQAEVVRGVFGDDAARQFFLSQ